LRGFIFLGGDKISADTNSAAFANEFNSSEARALENQTPSDKLANFFAVQFKVTNGANAIASPCWTDLLKSEWIFEVRESNYGSPEFKLKSSPEFALAIHLDSVRAEFWIKHLATVFRARDPTWLYQTNLIKLIQIDRANEKAPKRLDYRQLRTT